MRAAEAAAAAPGDGQRADAAAAAAADGPLLDPRHGHGDDELGVRPLHRQAAAGAFSAPVAVAAAQRNPPAGGRPGRTG